MAISIGLVLSISRVVKEEEVKKKVNIKWWKQLL
jgi:hypothetical protein